MKMAPGTVQVRIPIGPVALVAPSVFDQAGDSIDVTMQATKVGHGRIARVYDEGGTVWMDVDLLGQAAVFMEGLNQTTWRFPYLFVEGQQ